MSGEAFEIKKLVDYVYKEREAIVGESVVDAAIARMVALTSKNEGCRNKVVEMRLVLERQSQEIHELQKLLNAAGKRERCL
jgi:hypothetical protein